MRCTNFNIYLLKNLIEQAVDEDPEPVGSGLIGGSGLTFIRNIDTLQKNILSTFFVIPF
jgi:hypothetical protein